MSNNSREIGSRLREVRERRSMTQGGLATLAGVSRQTINYIEQGSYCPSTALALKLARLLGVTVEELFYLVEQ